MGMTNKQYQGFIKALAKIIDGIIKEQDNDSKSKQDIINDLGDIKKYSRIC